MTSKEVLEYLKTCKFCKIVMGTDYENDDRYFTLYDVFSEEIEIIQKDLERLEKLEKENQELKENSKKICECDVDKLNKIKKDLEILEIIKKWSFIQENYKDGYGPFTQFLCNIHTIGMEEDFNKVKEWLDND